jgi:hypothetical protein
VSCWRSAASPWHSPAPYRGWCRHS